MGAYGGKVIMALTFLPRTGTSSPLLAHWLAVVVKHRPPMSMGCLGISVVYVCAWMHHCACVHIHVCLCVPMSVCLILFVWGSVCCQPGCVCVPMSVCLGPCLYIP